MAGRNEQVIGYLQSLDIKTSRFGGFDKEDVYAHFKELSNIYEEERAGLFARAEELTEQNAELQARTTALEEQNAELLAQGSSLKEEIASKVEVLSELERSQREIEERYEALQSNVATLGEEAMNASSKGEERDEIDSAMYLAFLNEFKQFTAEKREVLKLKTEAEDAKEQLRICRDAIDQLLL